MLPAGLLVKVVPNPSEGLDCHQTGHVHLLHVVRGGQHDLVGVRLGGRKEAERTRRKRDKLLCHQGDGSDCVMLHERSCKSDLVDGKRHYDVGLLVNDFCFASWVTQVRLHLEISKHEPIEWK